MQSLLGSVVANDTVGEFACREFGEERLGEFSKFLLEKGALERYFLWKFP